MTAALAYFVTIGTVAGPFDRAAADAEIMALNATALRASYVERGTALSYYLTS